MAETKAKAKNEGPATDDKVDFAGIHEEDSPTITEGQVHPAVGPRSPVTQEGRDIRDGSQHVQALLTILGRQEEELSDIQKQKLDSHPALKERVGEFGDVDGDGLIEAMKVAQSDQERQAIIDAATALRAQDAVALLREPEDPNADPVRDRPAPEYRTAE